MSATTTRNAGTSAVSMPVKLPAHPTYNLKSIIQLAQSEDASDLGDMTCKTTIPLEKEVNFLAKEDGIVAGIALADMVFDEVDPSLKIFVFLKSSGIERMVIMYTKACNLVKYMLSRMQLLA